MKPYWMLENETPNGFPVIGRKQKALFTICAAALFLDMAICAVLVGWVAGIWRLSRDPK